MFANFCRADSFGVLRGSVSRTGTVEIVAVDGSDLPTRGDFALMRHADGRLLVLRVTSAEIGGAFAERSDRGEEYLANFGRYGDGQRPVPVRIRELAVRYRLQALPLGWLCAVGERAVFEPGFRDLGLFGEQVYLPTSEALSTLVNLGLEQEDPASIVRLGVYARGHEATETPVRFSINRLKGKRTFVFARAGYGKSNLTKLLLSRLYSSKPDVGLLIIDPDGEYAFDQRSETGGTIRGFANHPDLRDRVTVFTGRTVELSKGRPNVHELGIDLRQVSPEAFVTLFVDPSKFEQVWVSRIRALARRPHEWKRLIDELASKGFGVTDQVLASILGVRVQESGDGRSRGSDVTLNAIRNNVIPVIDRLHRPGSRMLSLARERLSGRADQSPGVVILDVSVTAAPDADAIVRALLGQVFGEAVQNFTNTDERRPGALLVLEEAQSVLGGAHLDDRDIYVRWVKEGRKYGLGAMMITQQPGSLSTELISQGDNFFAMHLLNERDLHALGGANAHFTPELLDFIRNEPVKGNCYFWSAPLQPFVVPARIDTYEAPTVDLVGRTGELERPTATTEPPAAKTVAPGSAPSARPIRRELLRRAVVKSLLTEQKAWLYPVSSVDGEPVTGVLCVASSFVGGPAYKALSTTSLEAEDISNDEGHDRLSDATLIEALRADGLVVGSGLVTAELAGRERRALLIDLAALRRVAAERSVTLRAAVQTSVQARSANPLTHNP